MKPIVPDAPTYRAWTKEELEARAREELRQRRPEPTVPRSVLEQTVRALEEIQPIIEHAARLGPDGCGCPVCCTVRHVRSALSAAHAALKGDGNG